jgi:hypothetical protein
VYASRRGSTIMLSRLPQNREINSSERSQKALPALPLFENEGNVLNKKSGYQVVSLEIDEDEKEAGGKLVSPKKSWLGTIFSRRKKTAGKPFPTGFGPMLMRL